MPTLTVPQAFDLACRSSAAGDWPRAEALCRQILSVRSDHAEAMNLLGVALQHRGAFAEAVATFRGALALHPNLAAAWYNLGNAFREQEDFDAAIAAWRRALEIQPDFPQALNNLANALKETGDAAGAIAIYRRALSVRPDPRVAGSLIYTLHFDPDCGPEQLRDEHLEWDRRYARPLAGALPPIRVGRTRKRTRIGFVSPDFRNHPVGRFLLPLLEHLDRSAFEVFCYSDVRRPDSLTRRLQSHADSWQTTTALNDENLARLIRRDGVDVLFDLTMHMEGNRLLTFARRAAPVQITWLAYCGTTGLSAMDWRLTDPHLDPPGDDSLYSEKSIRLARTYWCYPPPAEAPPIGPPADVTGHVTFGCLNNYSKVSPQVLEVWARILEAVPESRIVIASRAGAHRALALRTFAERGVDPLRVEFVAPMPFEAYLRQYDRIDIGLDPFPYPGGTTTCDALWMGVPVVTLAGRTAVSRAGRSILTNVELTDMIATDMEQYVRIAVELTRNPVRRAELRASLRSRMLASPLMDAVAFARDFEEVCRRAIHAAD